MSVCAVHTGRLGGRSTLSVPNVRRQCLDLNAERKPSCNVKSKMKNIHCNERPSHAAWNELKVHPFRTGTLPR